MGRTVAVAWHASFAVLATALYVLFVLPRWWELTGHISPTLGTALRITAGVVIGLAALPVLFTLVRTRKPEYGTPQLALTLRVWSIIGHVLAGVLIAGTAISEIWLSLDDAGQWLFGIYGAAAAVALLGIAGFYLAFAAELPPPPPKPLKAAEPKQSRRGRDKDVTADEAAESGGDEEAEATAEVEDTPAADADTVSVETDAEAKAETEAEADEQTEADEQEAEPTEDTEPEEPAEPEEVPITVETLDVEEPAKPRSRWGRKASSKREAKADRQASTAGLKNRRPSGKVNRRSSSNTQSKPK